MPATLAHSPVSAASQAVTTAGGRRVALAAPRGFAKSTLCSFLLPLWAVCFNQRHFIILISNTHSQAVKFLHAIRTEFEVNEALKENFPDLKPNPDKWADDELELSAGSERYKLLAIGSGAQLRGLKFLHYRPDLIILDDIENDELVESEARRNDLQWWLDHVVLYTNPEAWIVMVGTILHEQALLNRIVRHVAPEDQRSYGDWQTQLFTALDAQTSAWQEFLSTERLKELAARDPGGFQQEMMNEPYAAGYQPFKPEYFSDERWYTRLPEELSISLTVDPACTDKEASDETAINVSGWDAYGKLWVLDESHGKWTDPSETLRQIFVQYTRWQAECARNPGWRFFCVGIEKNAFQRYLLHLFNQAARARGFRPYVKELKGDVRKVRRIWQLEPLFKENRIFLRPDMTALEVQLRSFRVDGKYAHDDLCLAEGTMIATRRGNVPIEQMRVGDEALTPSGFRRVTATGYTGPKPVQTVHGVVGTSNHPLFTYGRGFVPLDTLSYYDKIDILSWTGLIRWAYRRLLYGMVSSSVSWEGRDAITLASHEVIKDESIRKDCMWRCGKLLQDGQFRQAMSFITKTGIRLITTLVTWSVYRWQSTVGCRTILMWKKIGDTWLRFEDWLLAGIALAKGVVGISYTPDVPGTLISPSGVSAVSATNIFWQPSTMRCFVQEPVGKPQGERVSDGMKRAFAACVKNNFNITDTSQVAPVLAHAEQSFPGSHVPVYNLTVEEAGCYYANGVLVSNCDALAYHLQLGSLLPQRLPPPVSEHDAYKLNWGEYIRLSEQKADYAQRFPEWGTRLTPQGVKPWYWLGN